VRLKVAVANNTQEPILDLAVDLEFAEDVLRLAKVDPPTYPREGPRVELGTLKPGDRVTVAYYFDPQICTSSSIDGKCTYTDAKGAKQTAEMKARRADVVCPLFFTKEQANSAVLRRLIETELRQFDVRGYTIRAEGRASYAKVFDELRSAVLAHDVQLVRAHEEPAPYFAEAWFYGTTQAKGYKMIIRASLDAKTGRAEFFVASTTMRPVTGLLAELHHTFTAAAEARLSAYDVVPLVDEGLRGRYADLSLVSKMLEGEAEAGESDE